MSFLRWSGKEVVELFDIVGVCNRGWGVVSCGHDGSPRVSDTSVKSGQLIALGRI